MFYWVIPLMIYLTVSTLFMVGTAHQSVNVMVWNLFIGQAVAMPLTMVSSSFSLWLLQQNIKWKAKKEKSCLNKREPFT